MDSFFELVKDRVGADAQHVCRIADATAIHGHVRDLLLYIWQVASIAVLSNEGTTRTLSIATTVTLFFFIALAILHDICTVTAWTADWFQNHINKNLRTALFSPMIHRSRTLPKICNTYKIQPGSFYSMGA